MVSTGTVMRVLMEAHLMTRKTCAACDCDLDDNTIKVKVRGRTVEVCCADCARKLKEADASIRPEGSARS